MTRRSAKLGALWVGAAVEVLWGGQYWAAKVTKAEGVDRYAIRYDGYGPEWDEVVGPDCLRMR